MHYRLWGCLMLGSLLGALLLSSCGQATPQASAPEANTFKPQPTREPVAPVTATDAKVTPFEVTTLDGEPFAVTATPAKPVVLYFMAAWCASCLPEAQALAELQQKYGHDQIDVLVLDVDPGDTAADIQAFREASGLSKHWAHDAEGRVLKAFQVQALDSTIVIDRDGQIVYRDARPTSLAVLERTIAPLLQ